MLKAYLLHIIFVGHNAKNREMSLLEKRAGNILSAFTRGKDFVFDVVVLESIGNAQIFGYTS